MKMQEIEETPEGPVMALCDISASDARENKRFINIIEAGDLAFSQIIPYAFVLFGNTKVGKTTLSHYLVNNTLKGGLSESNQPIYLLPQQVYKYKQALIGNTNKSQTEIPNEFSCEVRVNDKLIKAKLIDCPGYLDSFGCYRIISNAYFHYRIFSKIEKIKFLIVFDDADMQGGMEKIKNTIQSYLSAFKDIKSIKDRIFSSTAFVITKVVFEEGKEGTKIQNIKNKLKALSEISWQLTEQPMNIVRQLLNTVITNSRIALFPKAIPGRSSASNSTLEKIQAMIPEFWERKSINGTVDMRDIEFSAGDSISDAIYANKGSQQSKKDFEAIMAYQKNRLNEIFKSDYNPQCSLQEVITTFLQDALISEPNSHEFFSLIKKFNQKFYTFDANMKYIEKRKIAQDQILKIYEEIPYKVNWIQKLQITKQIIDIIFSQKFGFNKIKRQVSTVDMMTLHLLEALNSMKKMRFFDNQTDISAYQEEIKRFLYVIYRVLHQAKIFILIFSCKEQKSENNLYGRYSDVFQVFIDFTQASAGQNSLISSKGPSGNNFQNLKKDFIIEILPVTNYEPSEFMEVEKYIGPLTQSSIEAKEKLNQLNFKKISSNKSGKNEVKSNNIPQILKVIENIEMMLPKQEGAKKISSKESLIKAVNLLGNSLAKNQQNSKEDKIQTIRRLKLAIDCFNSVKNVFKSINCYMEILKKSEENLDERIQTLLKFGDFAAKHGRIELAMSQYQQAYSLIEENEDQRINVARLIADLGTSKAYSPSLNYFEELFENKFYEQLPQALRAAILKELKN